MIVGNKVDLNFPGAGTQLLGGPNPNRVGIIAGSASASVYFLTFGDPQSNNTGIRFAAGSVPPWTLLFDKPNPFITGPIWVQSQGAALVSFYELIDAPG